jgi:hypothetical protein
MRTRTKILATVLSVLGLVLATAGRARARDVDQFDILTGFGAKEACSCVFVADQSDEYCQAFGQTGAAPVKLVVDRKAQTVEASFGAVTRIARFTQDEGCQTEALPPR